MINYEDAFRQIVKVFDENGFHQDATMIATRKLEPGQARFIVQGIRDVVAAVALETPEQAEPVAPAQQQKPATAKAEPKQAEHAKADPAKADPAKVEPAKRQEAPTPETA